ncbi:histone deacetylase, partial [Genlisea aurea]
NEYIKYFAPDYSLKCPSGHLENLNSKSYLNTIRQQVCENLNSIQHAPGVQMHEARVPPDFYIPDSDEDEQNPEERVTREMRDKNIRRDDEYYDDENDNDHAMDDS